MSYTSSPSPSPNTGLFAPPPQELQQLMQDILKNKQNQPELNDDDEVEVDFKLTPEHIERAGKYGY